MKNDPQIKNVKEKINQIELKIKSIYWDKIGRYIEKEDDYGDSYLHPD